MTPAQLVRQVGRRARELFIFSNGAIDFDAAERMAAREIAAERRSQRLSATLPVAPLGPVTVHNARAVLIAKVMAVAERLRVPLPRKPRDAPPTSVARGPSRPLANINKSSGPEQDPIDTMLLFTGTGSGAELIPDSDFHRSVLDLSTANWRASIRENERRARERGRL